MFRRVTKRVWYHPKSRRPTQTRAQAQIGWQARSVPGRTGSHRFPQKDDTGRCGCCQTNYWNWASLMNPCPTRWCATACKKRDQAVAEAAVVYSHHWRRFLCGGWKMSWTVMIRPGEFPSLIMTICPIQSIGHDLRLTTSCLSSDLCA